MLYLIVKVWIPKLFKSTKSWEIRPREKLRRTCSLSILTCLCEVVSNSESRSCCSSSSLPGQVKEHLKSVPAGGSLLDKVLLFP